jgi:hypothetical protein
MLSDVQPTWSIRDGVVLLGENGPPSCRSFTFQEATTQVSTGSEEASSSSGNSLSSLAGVLLLPVCDRQ